MKSRIVFSRIIFLSFLIVCCVIFVSYAFVSTGTLHHIKKLINEVLSEQGRSAGNALGGILKIIKGSEDRAYGTILNFTLTFVTVVVLGFGVNALYKMYELKDQVEANIESVKELAIAESTRQVETIEAEVAPHIKQKINHRFTLELEPCDTIQTDYRRSESYKARHTAALWLSTYSEPSDMRFLQRQLTDTRNDEEIRTLITQAINRLA